MLKDILHKNYQGKTVLVTGHTGFKGCWLALWLSELGANVIGYALPPQESPNLFEMTHLKNRIISIEGDIRDSKKIQEVIDEHQPEIIFHLAAQAIVLKGYENPKETCDVNVGGTINILEAIRTSPFIKAAVIITTDKCYENLSWAWGYRENDALGGKDPYSASKSMCELALAAYRDSFFNSKDSHKPLVASARAGNIIGGGDFSSFRIVPDCIKALIDGKIIQARSPDSVRPWFYLLDALNGYLQLGIQLLNGNESYADAWNFGPKEQRGITVSNLIEKVISLWGCGEWEDASCKTTKKEMVSLRLNWDKAANKLNWNPIYNWEMALEETIHWYRGYQAACWRREDADLQTLCLEQINRYGIITLDENCPNKYY